MKVVRCFLLAVGLTLLLSAHCQELPAVINLVASFSQTGGFGNPNEFEWQSAGRIAVEHINANETILPNTVINFTYGDDHTTQKDGLAIFLSGLALNPFGLVGAASSRVCTTISFAGSFYQIPQISYSCTSVALSNKENHPYFLRVVPPDNGQSKAIADLIVDFGWEEVAGISTADEYGVTGIQAFQDAVDELGSLTLVRVEQFITGSITVETQVTNLKNSEARVFLSFMTNADHLTVMTEASKQRLVGPTYVWICPDGCASSASFLLPDGTRDETVYKAMAGTLGTRPAGGRGPLYEELLEDWKNRDPEEYEGAGKDFMHPFAAASYDAVWAFALTADFILRNEPRNFTGANMLHHLRNISFTGVTGQVFFDQNYDRLPEYEFLNLPPGEDLFQVVGTWTVDKGVEIDRKKIIWYDGTNQVPDLDVRPPRDYFSCHDREEKTDPTGKRVKIEDPDAGDVNNIDDDYYCDEYVDCENLADEYFDCSVSIVPAYITFGIFTSVLIIATLILLVIVFFFGCIPWRLRFQRFHGSNPFYLLILLIAALVGYLSTFSFYGKPTKVSCGFQPWLVGPSVALLVSALCVRSAYIFWSLRSKYEVIKFSIWKFSIPLILLNIPFYIVLILWTILSTPTAAYIEVDDRDHYVCASRGIVDDIGIVFFFILYGYLVFLLFCSVVIVFLTRSIKDKYHTAKAVALSVTNLFFLAIVIVALFWLKITEQTPVGVFIFTQIAIIYGFASVLFFHFAPIFAGMLKDKIFPKKDQHESKGKVKPAEDD